MSHRKRKKPTRFNVNIWVKKLTQYLWPPRWIHLGVLLCLFGLYFLLVPGGAEFKNQNPKTTSLIEIRRAQAIAKGQAFTPRYEWVPLSRISPSMLKAVVAAEDWKFYSHHGIDFSQLGEAIGDAVRHFRFPRGASTISQQLAKNLYLSESKNPLRKFTEVLITLKLEHNLGKNRIMEIYLNVIEWGEGIFGIAAAARTYFGESPENLTESQAAFLAAMIPNPRRLYNPKLHLRRVESRKIRILDFMKKVHVPAQSTGTQNKK